VSAEAAISAFESAAVIDAAEFRADVDCAIDQDSAPRG
jgi:hypothetical protein